MAGRRSLADDNYRVRIDHITLRDIARVGWKYGIRFVPVAKPNWLGPWRLGLPPDLTEGPRRWWRPIGVGNEVQYIERKVG